MSDNILPVIDGVSEIIKSAREDARMQRLQYLKKYRRTIDKSLAPIRKEEANYLKKMFDDEIIRRSNLVTHNIIIVSL